MISKNKQKNYSSASDSFSQNSLSSNISMSSDLKNGKTSIKNPVMKPPIKEMPNVIKSEYNCNRALKLGGATVDQAPKQMEKMQHKKKGRFFNQSESFSWLRKSIIFLGFLFQPTKPLKYLGFRASC